MGLLNFYEGVEFLIALGSIVGLLGLVVGLILLIFGGPRIRMRIIHLLLISIVLISICGFYTGKTYFHIH